MQDRLQCTPAILSNGIKVYLYQHDIPFVSLRYVVPFGHKHNQGDILPGSFHFLEHLALNRSKEFPERDSFSRYIGLHGGDLNAYTTLRSTGFEMSVPLTIKERALKGFFSQIFDILFTEDDIKREATVIQNERKRKERWYPGFSEISNYLQTKWRHRDPKFITTIFGSDKDHAKYSVAYFEKLQDFYRTDRGYLLVAGHISLQEIEAVLTTYQTKSVEAPDVPDPGFVWKHPEFTERAFDDETRYQYYIGGHLGALTFDDFFTMRFLESLLFNHVHGPIYKWLRDEKGWLYEIKYGFDYEYGNTPWTVIFPLSTIQQVETVRKELKGRIERAIADEQLIQEEVTRLLGLEVFQYQRAQYLLDDAEVFLSLFNMTGSEEQIRSVIQTMTPAKLQNFYRERILGNQIGEILTTPKKKLDIFGVRKLIGEVTEEIGQIVTHPKRRMNRELTRIKRRLQKLI